MSKNLVVENTLYSLLLYWLITSPKDSIYILEDSINDEIIENIRKLYPTFIFNPKYNSNIIYRIFRVFLIEKIKLRLFIFKYKVNNINIYGNDNLVAFDIFRNKNYYILEDGIINYNFLNSNKKYGFIHKLLRGFYIGYPYGLSKKCKKIYLTNSMEIPQAIYNKVQIVDLKKLWNLKSIEDKSEILSLLNIDINYIKKFHNKNILITQPLSEDGHITEKEKIDIYKKILLEYGEDSIIIKPHPREKTNYKQVFKNSLIIDKPFPSELFYLLDIKINKVITLFSTAVYGFGNEVEIVWLGSCVHPKLVRERGIL